MKIPDLLYHYTVGPKIGLISDSGYLKPFGFGKAVNAREKPILWWSTNSHWEPTATKLISLDRGKTYGRPPLEKLHEIVGCYRFCLNTRRLDSPSPAGIKLLPWARLPLVAGIDSKDVYQMVMAGLAVGAQPNHWWGCLDPVSLELEAEGILTVEVLDNGGWVPLTGTPEALALASTNTRTIVQSLASQVPHASLR